MIRELRELREFFFDALVKSSEDYLKQFNKKNGRFLENGGWAITKQDPMLAYAYLYMTKGKDNKFYNNPETLSVIVNAIKALRDFQYPDGQLEFVKTDGSALGPIYMPWTFYHWLETYQLLKNEIEPDMKKDWEIGLFPAFRAFNDKDLASKINNINLWNIMSLHRAGIVFENEEWIRRANSQIGVYLTAQKPEGIWEEYGGPTTGYNHVYVHALGLYRFHGGQIDVTDALKKAIAFHQVFTYPDGSAVETMDGRRQYHKPGWGGQSVVLPTGYPGFIATQGGIRLLSSRMPYTDKCKISLPYTASMLMILDAIIADKDLAARFVDEDEGYMLSTEKTFSACHGKGAIIRKKGMQTALSAYTAPVLESEFSLDRCSFVSVWTEKSGLILGSGNSKNKVNHSSFVITNKNEQEIYHIPTDGKLVSENEVILNYEKAVCKIQVDISEKGEVLLKYSANTCSPEYSWYINLPLRPDFTFENSDIMVIRGKHGNTIRFSDVEVYFKENYELKMPSFTLTPYFQYDRIKIDEWLATVSVYPDEDKEIVIKIKGM